MSDFNPSPTRLNLGIQIGDLCDIYTSNGSRYNSRIIFLKENRSGIEVFVLHDNRKNYPKKSFWHHTLRELTEYGITFKRLA